MSKIPTIREIAKACGYNNSTVSRAFNNHRSIPAATRKKILDKANEMGWKPNPLVAAYVAHRHSNREPKYQATLALILDREDASSFEELPGYIKQIYEGAKRRAEGLGYKLELFWLHEVSHNLKALSRILKSRGIPGIIVVNDKKSSPENSSDFDWDSFALATVGHTFMKPHLHRSAFYWPHGARKILTQISQAGYKDIALVIHTRLDRLTDFALSSTFYHHAKHSTKEIRYHSMVVPSFSTSNQKVKNWLIKTKPDVVVGNEDVWYLLEEMGWRIPEDIAFASPQWSPLWPNVAGLDQDPELIGSNALELVVTQLIYNERGIPDKPRLLLNEGQWISGQSLPDKSSSALKVKRRQRIVAQ